MKKISIFLFAAAALIWGAGCEESSDTDKEITVSAIALDSSLSGGITLVVGETTNIAGKVSVLPEEAAGLPESYHSSDTSIVTVDEAGNVKAVSPGLAMITITVGGKNAHFEVKIEAQKIPVETVTLPEEWADGVTLKAGETMDIANKASYTPSDATHTDESYASSNEEVATVSAEGIVTALKPGETEITITIDSKPASFTLTVEKIAVETVTLPDELANGITMIIGETRNIAGQATIAPENATYKEESYDSSDKSVATVSETGEIEALAAGETEITVTVDGVDAKFTLTVKSTGVLIDEITLSETSQEIDLGETLDLIPLLTITPADNTEGVTYTSSNPEVATVDDKGMITSKAVGETTITVSAKDHADVKAELTLIVCGDYDRTGWAVSETSHPLFKTNSDSEKNSLESLLDGDYTTKFCMVRPDKNFGDNPNVAVGIDEAIWFVVDMGAPQTINYFRLRHSDEKTYRLRWWAFDEILVSTDGKEFTKIAENVDTNANSIGIESANIEIPTTTCRYVKFYAKSANCFNERNHKSAGVSVQLQELYLGREKANAGE